MEESRDKTPFNCIITGPTKCGKTKYLIEQLRGPFRGIFDSTVSIFPTYANNKKYHGFARGDRGFLVLSPNSSNSDEINELLNDCATLFNGTNTLIILDDCAVSKDLKKRSTLHSLIDIKEHQSGL